MPEGFFEFRSRVTARSRKAAFGKDTGRPAAEHLSVTQLTNLIDQAIKTGIPQSVLVNGEVSNLNHHRASGHLYFTLKDSSACIDCVMFRSDAAKLKFVPEDGAELLARGRVAIYPQRGRYQLYVTSLRPIGKGALELAFQQLRAKLEQEGLFDAARKKPIPRFPISIAMITSRSTAALQDMLKVLRRFPQLRPALYHVPVQGEGSAEKIADAIKHLNRARGQQIDVILLGRGGGSLEDLWAFNEEVVARAVAGSKIPVITGIGHEVDVSIADLVADYHAHTPTEAAQVVTIHWRNVPGELSQMDVRLHRGLRQSVADARQRLISAERHEIFRRPLDRVHNLRQLLDDRERALLLGLTGRLRSGSGLLERLSSRLADRHPRHLIRLSQQQVDQLSARLANTISHHIQRRSERLEALGAHLNAISPQQVLKRGFTITTRKKDGSIIRSAAMLKEGDRIVTKFSDGAAESRVEDRNQPPLFED